MINKLIAKVFVNPHNLDVEDKKEILYKHESFQSLLETIYQAMAKLMSDLEYLEI